MKERKQATKAIILARVSSKEQEEGYSIDAQKHRVQEYRSVDNILTCSIVGALLLFGVIEVATYREDMSGKLQLEFINDDDVDFFQIAQMNISQLMNSRVKAAERNLNQAGGK